MSSQESAAMAPTLTQGNEGRRRRRSAPPQRLSWPGGSATSSSQPSYSQPDKKTKKSSSRGSSNNKRKKTLMSAFQHVTGEDDENQKWLWVDRYAPQSSAELCVAPKKVKEVVQWLEEDDKQLLVLVGKPGVGKSAMMHVLASETHRQVLEWNDSYSTWTHELEALSPLNSFAKFLQQSSVGFTSLDIQMTNNGASNNNPSNAISHNKRLILLEELPNLANEESERKFKELMSAHVKNSKVKTVWIYSDGTEGQHKPQDLERHFLEPNDLYRHSKIMSINPVTKAQVRKCLERIAKAEKVSITKDFCERIHLQSGGDIRYAIMSLQFDQAGKKKGGNNPDAEHSRDTQWSSFHALGKILYAKREEPAKQSASTTSQERPPLNFDPEGVLEHCDLDLGHALTYLGFHSADFFTDVEELSQAFDFYSDASFLLEQSTSFNYQRRRNFSGGSQTTISCPIYPEGYVTSLASRAVAYSNLHPAASKFRQLQAPKVLEIRRKRIENAYQLSRLQQRMSAVSISDATAATKLSFSRSTTTSSLSSFVMDQVPYLRSIVPHEVNASLSNLHTSASEDVSKIADHQVEDEGTALERIHQEQQEILQFDDITEFSSDEEENATSYRLAKPKTQQLSHNAYSQPQPSQTNTSTERAATSTTNGISQPTTTQQAILPQRPAKPLQRVENPYKKQGNLYRKQENPYRKPDNPYRKAENPYKKQRSTSQDNPYKRKSMPAAIGRTNDLVPSEQQQQPVLPLSQPTAKPRSLHNPYSSSHSQSSAEPPKSTTTSDTVVKEESSNSEPGLQKENKKKPRIFGDGILMDV